MNGFVVMILCVIALPLMGVLFTYVIAPFFIWVSDVSKKLSAISVKKFPKTSKFIGRILIAIWCIIFLGVMCVIFFKDCSETMQNINTDSEYFDDTHRPDRF